MRKTSVAALALIFITAATFSQAWAEVDRTPLIFGPSAQAICCTSYIQRALPLRILASYVRGSDRCSRPAVIFSTKKGQQFCADPEAVWTQDRIRALDGTEGN